MISSTSTLQKSATLALLASSAALSRAAAAPWPLVFSTDETVGPDGPWNVIAVSPTNSSASWNKVQHFFPSLLETSVTFNASQAPASKHDSDAFAPSTWTEGAGEYMADVMGLEGSLRYSSGHLMMRKEDNTTAVLSQVATAAADNISVTYPGGLSYTLDTGFLSLYGANDTFTWTASDGATMIKSLMLPSAYHRGLIPSISYGLHIGSATHNVSGSLWLGGYDQARAISDPVTASEDDGYFSLVDISLGVASGASVLLNTSSSMPLTGLLDTSGAHKSSNGSLSSIRARADPGVPYLYLPGTTCAAIAAHLPVRYAPEYGLYLWNTTDDSYEPLLSSPHYLAFTFSAPSNDNTTITLPLTLLNLSLTSPITDTNDHIPYLPCRPFDTASSSSSVSPHAILGRAFLQNAFLAQNWHTRISWLAQAPGPIYAADESVATISDDATVLTPLAGSPATWAQSWEGLLTPLEDLDFTADPPLAKKGASFGRIRLGALNWATMSLGGKVGLIIFLSIVGPFVLWFVVKLVYNVLKCLC